MADHYLGMVQNQMENEVSSKGFGIRDLSSGLRIKDIRFGSND